MEAQSPWRAAGEVWQTVPSQHGKNLPARRAYQQQQSLDGSFAKGVAARAAARPLPRTIDKQARE